MEKAGFEPRFATVEVDGFAIKTLRQSSQYCQCCYYINCIRLICFAYSCVTGVNYRYDEELVVPIVENTPEERDLKVCSIICGVRDAIVELKGVSTAFWL